MDGVISFHTNIGIHDSCVYLKVYELHESDTATTFYDKGSHEDTMIQSPMGKLYLVVRRVRGANPFRSHPLDTTFTYYLTNNPYRDFQLKVPMENLELKS